MLKLSRLGVVIFPAMPAFYQHPQSVDDIIEQTVTRILDQVDVHLETARWDGEMAVRRQGE
jgi:flavin prenyltransferase